MKKKERSSDQKYANTNSLKALTKHCPIKISRKLLTDQYFDLFNFYFAKPINEIIANISAPHVVWFQQHLFYDDKTEYLQRWYQSHQVPPRVKLLTDFYENSYAPIRPYVVPTDQGKLILRRNEQIQKMYYQRQERQKQGPPQTKRENLKTERDEDIIGNEKLLKTDLMENDNINFYGDSSGTENSNSSNTGNQREGQIDDENSQQMRISEFPSVNRNNKISFETAQHDIYSPKDSYFDNSNIRLPTDNSAIKISETLLFTQANKANYLTLNKAQPSTQEILQLGEMKYGNLFSDQIALIQLDVDDYELICQSNKIAQLEMNNLKILRKSQKSTISHNQRGDVNNISIKKLENERSKQFKQTSLLNRNSNISSESQNITNSNNRMISPYDKHQFSINILENQVFSEDHSKSKSVIKTYGSNTKRSTDFDEELIENMNNLLATQSNTQSHLNQLIKQSSGRASQSQLYQKQHTNQILTTNGNEEYSIEQVVSPQRSTFSQQSKGAGGNNVISSTNNQIPKVVGNKNSTNNNNNYNYNSSSNHHVNNKLPINQSNSQSNFNTVNPQQQNGHGIGNTGNSNNNFVDHPNYYGNNTPNTNNFFLNNHANNYNYNNHHTNNPNSNNHTHEAYASVNTGDRSKNFTSGSQTGSNTQPQINNNQTNGNLTHSLANNYQQVEALSQKNSKSSESGQQKILEKRNFQVLEKEGSASLSNIYNNEPSSISVKKENFVHKQRHINTQPNLSNALNIKLNSEPSMNAYQEYTQMQIPNTNRINGNTQVKSNEKPEMQTDILYTQSGVNSNYQSEPFKIQLSLGINIPQKTLVSNQAKFNTARTSQMYEQLYQESRIKKLKQKKYNNQILIYFSSSTASPLILVNTYQNSNQSHSNSKYTPDNQGTNSIQKAQVPNSIKPIKKSTSPLIERTHVSEKLNSVKSSGNLVLVKQGDKQVNELRKASSNSNIIGNQSQSISHAKTEFKLNLHRNSALNIPSSTINQNYDLVPHTSRNTIGATSGNYNFLQDQTNLNIIDKKEDNAYGMPTQSSNKYNPSNPNTKTTFSIIPTETFQNILKQTSQSQLDVANNQHKAMEIDDDGIQSAQNKYIVNNYYNSGLQSTNTQSSIKGSQFDLTSSVKSSKPSIKQQVFTNNGQSYNSIYKSQLYAHTGTASSNNGNNINYNNTTNNTNYINNSSSSNNINNNNNIYSNSSNNITNNNGNGNQTAKNHKISSVSNPNFYNMGTKSISSNHNNQPNNNYVATSNEKSINNNNNFGSPNDNRKVATNYYATINNDNYGNQLQINQLYKKLSPNNPQPPPPSNTQVQTESYSDREKLSNKRSVKSSHRVYTENDKAFHYD